MCCIFFRCGRRLSFFSVFPVVHLFLLEFPRPYLPTCLIILFHLVCFLSLTIVFTSLPIPLCSPVHRHPVHRPLVLPSAVLVFSPSVHDPHSRHRPSPIPPCHRPPSLPFPVVSGITKGVASLGGEEQVAAVAAGQVLLWLLRVWVLARSFYCTIAICCLFSCDRF